MNYSKSSRFIWLPRALAAAYIIFLALFALDAVEVEKPLLEKVLGFVIHLIPNFLLIIVLVLSWKRPAINGVIFIVISIVFALFFRRPVTLIILSLPLALIGILFIIAGKNTKSSWLKNYGQSVPGYIICPQFN